MRKLALLLSFLAVPLAAQDAGPFSEGSTARSWNLFSEETAFFEARVVDVLCELTGDCRDDCGAGGRQLGLLRSADDALVLATKNSQPAFSGAVQELLPYCGQTVEVDGLLVGDPDLTAAKMFLVQKIRLKGESDWVKGNKWTKVWAQNNPEVGGKGPWFRRDPRVNELISREGHLGLGPEEDARFIEEWF